MHAASPTKDRSNTPAMSNVCNENIIEYSNYESANTICILHPSNDFKKEITYENDDDECNNKKTYH